MDPRVLRLVQFALGLLGMVSNALWLHDSLVGTASFGLIANALPDLGQLVGKPQPAAAVGSERPAGPRTTPPPNV